VSTKNQSTEVGQIQDLRQKINGYRSDCGCALGAIFFFVGASLYILRVFTTGSFGLRTPFVGVGIALACAMAGKFAGIGIARIKLRLVQRHVVRRGLPLDLIA
jgi:hypothetical protein